jgi:myo-inositol-1(or 4)-monophosphatase
MIFKKVLFQAAKAAGDLQLRSFGKLKRTEVRHKAHNEFVTYVDQQSERAIIRTIRGHYPADTIISEEAGVQRGRGPHTWIVDPLDGTTNYSIGNPLFGTSIAVADSRGVVEGVFYFPVLKRWWYARRGHGAFFNNRRVHVSKNPLASSIVAFGFPHILSAVKEGYKIMRQLRPYVANIRFFGSGSYTCCAVASGQVDAEITTGPLHLWDVHPGILFITEAGGRVTDIQGQPWHLQAHGLVLSNPNIHRQLVRRIK